MTPFPANVSIRPSFKPSMSSCFLTSARVSFELSRSSAAARALACVDLASLARAVRALVATFRMALICASEEDAKPALVPMRPTEAKSIRLSVRFVNHGQGGYVERTELR
jgi:hypothetical protein